MTAEELALMGYPAAPQQGPIQQPSPEELAAMGAGLGVGYPMAVMQGAPAPDIQQFAPQSAAGPQMDPQTLAMMGASDPNGFISDPSGPPPLPLPGNPGEAMPAPTEATAGNMGVTGNPATNAYTPDGAANQVSAQAPPSTQPTQATNPDLAVSAGFPQFGEWAKASGLPRQVMPDERKLILEKYLDQQKDFLARQDPEKLLKLQEAKLAVNKSTTEQAETLAKKVDAIPEVQNNIQLLDNLVAHKGLSDSVGAKSAAFLYGMKSEPIAGTQAADFMERVKQVQGKNFLLAFNQLKGAGQITEIEGAKAQSAIARLGTNQSEAAFRESVGELRGILETGLERSRERLASQAPVASAAAGSTTSSPINTPAPPSSSAPVIKTIPGRGVFQSLGNGQWKQIQ